MDGWKVTSGAGEGMCNGEDSTAGAVAWQPKVYSVPEFTFGKLKTNDA